MRGSSGDVRLPSRESTALLYSIIGFFVIFVIWAGFAEIDEVVRGQGRVIPSRQLQVIQNLEGGIVREILVRQGSRVTEGDVLVRLDKTRFNSELQSNRKLYADLVSRAVRLQAEADGTEPNFPPELVTQAPDVVSAESELFEARINELEDTVGVLSSRLIQRRQERAEATAAAKSARVSAKLAKEEAQMLEPLVEKGIEPRIELLRAHQRAENARATAQISRLLAERLGNAVIETEREIKATRSRFKSAALTELSEVRVELASLGEVIPAIADRVTRAEVRAPISGIVNRVHIATEGGVVQPGMPLVEIVPLDDTLFIEAFIAPADIAFVHVGQNARIKLSAYDYAVYGTLGGSVETVGADAVAVNDTGETAYLVSIRIEDASLDDASGTPLPILSGMVAEVDILAGKKTVLDYILTPVKRIQARAFQER